MVNWYNSDTRFFGMTNGVNDNTEELKFESGKTRSYLKNSSPIKKFTVSFLIWTRQDEVNFWDWYDNRLLSRTQTFSHSDFLTLQGQKEYRMTKDPDIEGGQYPKKCTIEIEEA